MGGEAFWIGNTRKSGIGLALRHVQSIPSTAPPPSSLGEFPNTSPVASPDGLLLPGQSAAAAAQMSVFSAQVASTGLVIANYVHKVSDKLSLATDFLYNWNTREATATIGYDYNMRQCKMQGR